MKPSKQYRQSLPSWACKFAIKQGWSDIAYIYARVAARAALIEVRHQS